MDFQVVVLAGGTSKNLVPLVSKEVPKALLPIANRPVLSYVLDHLEASCLKDLIVVVEGEENAVHVDSWISISYVDHLNVEVVAVPEDVGTAGAIRDIAHYLVAPDILIVSGDLVCDVSPGSVAATHRRYDATVTALLYDVPRHSENVSSAGKGTHAQYSNIVGLDATRQFLLHMATGVEIEKDLHILKTALWASSQMEICSSLMDAHMYAFKRFALLEILDQFPTFTSIKHDVVPYFVKSQFFISKPEMSSVAKVQSEDYWNHGVVSQTEQSWYIQRQKDPVSTLQNVCPAFECASVCVRSRHKCCVYIASRNQYCSRLNDIQAFCDINRDVIGDASHLSGCSFSSQNNVIHPSAELGTKTTVGANCMLGDGSRLGDKCSVKKSVIGRHCRIGSNVKIANSVVMNYVTIEDGCSLQGSVVCSSVHIQERAVLRDCQVGAGYVIAAGSQYKGESLARREKSIVL